MNAYRDCRNSRNAQVKAGVLPRMEAISVCEAIAAAVFLRQTIGG